MTSLQQPTQRAAYTLGTPHEHVGIDLSGFHVAVAQLLHRTGISAGLDKGGLRYA